MIIKWDATGVIIDSSPVKTRFGIKFAVKFIAAKNFKIELNPLDWA